MDGKPLPNVAVLFQPNRDGKMNTGAGSSGRTNDKGSYTLTVVGGGTGAVLGPHRVEIHPTVDGDPDDDRRRGFVVSDGGVTCVPKGAVVDAA